MYGREAATTDGSRGLHLRGGEGNIHFFFNLCLYDLGEVDNELYVLG